MIRRKRAHLNCDLRLGTGSGRRRFVSTWKTDNPGTSGSNQITLPLESSGTYDFYVHWGDGSIDHITAYNDPAVTHTYPAAGTYTVTIWGTIIGWRFNNGGDCKKILSINSWGPLRLGNSNSYFYGCSNLTIPATDTLNMTGTTSLYQAFRGCSSIVKFPSLASLDTSNVTSTGSMFNGCSAFNDAVSNFNTSKVIDMAAMFYLCPAFNQPVSNFDTSNVLTMSSMFNGCSAFNQSVSNFNTAKVTTMSYMFQNAYVFNQDVSGFNIEAITSLVNMFSGANNLSTANYDALLISWGAQNVHDSLSFHAGDAKYTPGGAAEAARTHLISVHSWTITDGGPV